MVCKPLIEGDSEQIGALLRVGEVAPDLRGVSRLLCKRPGFVFGDGALGKGAFPLPSPSL